MDKQQLIQCHERIKPFIHNTPVLTSRLINEFVNAQVFFKCENFQRMGAFKMRGATNAILQLSEGQRKNGVVTHSSGNFAQALSLAAQSLGVKAFIVMPDSAPQVKKEAVKGYGGIITECESTLEARENTTKEIEQRERATFIHPSNDDDVILGQGTAGKELLEVQPDLNYIVTPVGGGGLIAGNALAASFFGNNCRTIGGEPFEVDDAYRSMQSGTIETNSSTNTIADGLKTQLGDRNFPIIQRHVDQIIRVTEQEIVASMKLIWERLKIVCEPSSAVALAAVLRDKKLFTGKKIGVIISGGNVDLEKLPF
ncbi:pyridoxal-phosphate dependent enzyme [Flagellimonas sp. W118]|uniref:pyridoxal-phosphate dependent enzyme n=1 Tax=Flagellimonas sp. W118 TaxID=3410791 RepID=UPI003BF4EAFB